MKIDKKMKMNSYFLSLKIIIHINIFLKKKNFVDLYPIYMLHLIYENIWYT